MSTQLVIENPSAAETGPRWSLGTRIAFRFCVVYFGLFSLSTQIITTLLNIPKIDMPDPSTLPPVRNLIGITAAHVFHLTVGPAFFMGTGSGDRPCDWVLLFVILVIALLGTVLWSVLDRDRTNYVALRKWAWLFFRFALAGQMFTYALVKIVPLQMPFPALFAQIEPIGSQSPMAVLWNSIGASPAYEIFAGSAEFLGGLLILIPRTRTLGALICVVDMIQIFMLNMTYDVPVKILSLNLILLGLLIVAPECRRVENFLFLNRRAEARPPAPLFRSARKNRIAAIVQVVFAVWLIGLNIYGARVAWKRFGGGAPKPALYGIWDVEQQTIDGQIHPPLFTDKDRWRRVLFDRYQLMVFERFNDERVFDTVAIDAKTHTLTVSGRGGGQGKSTFAYTQPAPDRLNLDGAVDGHKEQMELRLADPSKFLMVSRGFHWVSPAPFNR
ncbi:MAG TPA: hypothetical protein VIY53_05090 [Acidobacteriaceae bacterium]